MRITIELEREVDGRWIAEAPDFPGVLVYGQDETDALQRVQALALRCIAERLESGEVVPGLEHITFSVPDHAPVAVC